jgi:hypothetical protein
MYDLFNFNLSGGIEMKLVKMVVIVAVIFVLGGVLGLRLSGNGLQATVPQLAAVAQPAAANESAALPVGMVGVLQAIGTQNLSVQTSAGMQLLTIGSSPALSQLNVGDKVAVWTQKLNGQNVVTKIVVVPQSPQRIHYVGLVSAVNGDKLDVVGQQGETTIFRFDQTLQALPAANHKPQIGDQVTVVAKPDPLGDGWLAVAIVKQ